jgi:hypothetical protein
MSILEARLQEQQLRNNSPHQMISVLLSGNRGRPSLYIPEDQLRFLVENNFTVAAIAEVFGCSWWTISRHLDELDLNISAAYSGISDADLDVFVEGLHTHSFLLLVIAQWMAYYDHMASEYSAKESETQC